MANATHTSARVTCILRARLKGTDRDQGRDAEFVAAVFILLLCFVFDDV